MKTVSFFLINASILGPLIYGIVTRRGDWIVGAVLGAAAFYGPMFLILRVSSGDKKAHALAVRSRDLEEGRRQAWSQPDPWRS